MKRKGDSGNAMFYVLIGTVLFAALSYAISQSTRGTSSALSEEKAGLAATEIIEFATTLATATGQIVLRGYGAGEIDFRNNIVPGYNNAGCSDEYCRIFGAEGGAVIYKTLPEEWLDNAYSAAPGYGQWVFSGRNAVVEVGDSATEDLVVFLPYLKLEVCKAINNRLGVTNPFDAPPKDTGTLDGFANKFTGAFAPADALSLSDPEKGRMAACFEGDAAPPAGSYHFYQVLVAR